MQQITKGQINEPTREHASLNESNLFAIEVLPEEIPDELGHELRSFTSFLTSRSEVPNG